MGVRERDSRSVVRFWPGEMAPTPEKVTVMMAPGSKVARRSGTSLALVKWASIAAMPKAVSLVDWALTRGPRKERATVVAKRNMVVVSVAILAGGFLFLIACSTLQPRRFA